MSTTKAPIRHPLWVVPALLVAACGSSESTGTKCNSDSTFGVVQAVFETRGCTNATCHGQPAETAGGGLDLRADNAYANLINVKGSSADMSLVFPGEQDLSLLYQKVAAKTLGADLSAMGISGSPMPSSTDVLTAEELELLRDWIRGGAPESGIVKEAAGALGCEPSGAPETPNKLPPLPPPSADDGVQFYSGAWALAAESEDEVCYVVYYDLTERVPEAASLPCPETYGGSDQQCFAYKDVLLAQDPQSHHSVVEWYVPPANKPEQRDPRNEAWKNWVCIGGANDGAACDPMNLGWCGERSACATKPATAFACTAYENGPAEMGTIAGFFGNAAARKNVVLAQESVFSEPLADGVYGLAPVRGFAIWNSHAFNLTLEDTTIEQYVNLTFSDASERVYQREYLAIFDSVFGMGVVPPFQSVEVCATFSLPVGTRMLTLSSHTHQHGRDFRIWYPPNDPCETGGLLGGPVEGCDAPDREPDYRSFQYQDPLYQRFDQQSTLALDSPDEEGRTFRYCAIFDNGADEPTTVRRHSERPDAQACELAKLSGGFLAECGCSPETRACLGGPNQGALCGEDDSVCGAEGVCDACPLSGGVTTEDEMFVVAGSYYETN
ncbi:MAG: hypothetical protein E4H00_02035 [Myxococcales bacterium]|nr:MAG: hypothetical protein E4H00_02035 [Myxococcales bacterium]